MAFQPLLHFGLRRNCSPRLLGVDSNSRRIPMKALIALLAGVALALLAQFPLEPLADQNDLVHWAQHGLLFWSGIVVGISITLLYRRGHREAAWAQRAPPTLHAAPGSPRSCPWVPQA